MLSAHCNHCLHKVGEPRDPPYIGDDPITLQIYYCYHCENYTDSVTSTYRR